MSGVRTVAVIGAGIMGRGIAHAAALGGYRTILEDLLPNALRKAETEIRANLDKAVALGKVNATDADAAFSRIEYAGSVDEAARLTGLSRDLLYDEMRRGHLPYVKVGRRRLITRQHLQQFLGVAS